MTSLIAPEFSRTQDQAGGIVSLVVKCYTVRTARALRGHLVRRGWSALQSGDRVQVFWPANRTDQDAEAAILEWWERQASPARVMGAR